jgi:hypothetical protein
MSDILAELDLIAPMLRSQILTPTNQPRDFVAIFLDGEQIVYDIASRPVRSDSRIDIIFAVAGG